MVDLSVLADATARQHEQHQCALVDRRCSDGSSDDPGPCVLLRRHGQGEVRHQHDDDELRRNCVGLSALGALRLLDVVRSDRRQGSHHRLAHRRAGCSTRSPTSGCSQFLGTGNTSVTAGFAAMNGANVGQHLQPRIRRLPGHVRHHHGRADLGCYRRPRKVRRVDGLRRRLGDPRLLPGRQLGVQLRG